MRIIFFRWIKIFNSSLFTVEKRQWRTNGNMYLLSYNIRLLNNRVLFDTAFDLQSCLQDLSRSFRCTVWEKVLYASSTAFVSALPLVATFLNHCYYDPPIAHCPGDGRRSQQSGGHFPFAWRFPRHEHVTTPRRHDNLHQTTRPRLLICVHRFVTFACL